MTLADLISWHRTEGVIARKKYEHALAHGLKSAARFRRAFIVHRETVEALVELDCRQQRQREATGSPRQPHGGEDEQCRSSGA
jgi:plasmid stabilization system protein ParE